MTNSKDYSLTLGFSNQTGTRVIVDAYDFGMSIAGASQAVQQSIALQSRREGGLEIRPLIVNVREGSILVDLLLATKETFPALIPVAPDLLKIGAESLSIVKGLIELLLALKGKKPGKVHHKSDGNVSVQIEGNNNVVIVKPIILAAHGDRIIRRGLGRLIKPLLSEDSKVDSIFFSHGKTKAFSIGPADAPYLAEAVEFLPSGEARLRGVVRKIDRKTRTGYLTVDSRRVSFQYPVDLPQDKLDILIQSLRTLQPIILIGAVSIDLQGLPRLLAVRDAIADPRLFE